MDRKEYRRRLAELEHDEAKMWREFCAARDAGLKDKANALHYRHQRAIGQIMRLHDAVMSEVVRGQNQREKLRA